MKSFKRFLPDFPRTPHLPYKPNVAAGDSVETEVSCLFNLPEGTILSVQEKIDGANFGVALLDGHPVIRNRTKILTKGFYKNTQAKKQFLPAWNWFYQHKDKFLKLEQADSNLAVYGEWMLMTHGLHYDRLPDWFIAYDLYDYEAQQFLSPHIALPMLRDAGFATVPEIHQGQLRDWQQLEEWCNQPTPFATDQKREGLYLKVGVSYYSTARYKMVREGFEQGGRWEEGIKNELG